MKCQQIHVSAVGINDVLNPFGKRRVLLFNQFFLIKNGILPSSPEVSSTLMGWKSTSFQENPTEANQTLLGPVCGC